MTYSEFNLPPLPDQLALTSSMEPSSGKSLQVLDKLIAESREGITLVTVSGLCGGCKSTLSRNIETAQKPKLIGTSLNRNTQGILSLDWLMSVSRGPQKIELLEHATADSIRRDFFRTKALAELIKAVRSNRAFSILDAYDADNQGQLTGHLQVNPEPGKDLIIAEGTVAQAAIEIALAETPDSTVDKTVSSINLLVYTDPAVALLNTVKRGVLEPNRKKDPHYAFREFLSFNSLLLPGYVQTDQYKAEVIYRPDDLNPVMFAALIDFFATPGYETLPHEFIAIIQADFATNDPLLRAQNDHILSVLAIIHKAVTARAQR